MRGMAGRLAGKVALVTGAATGIGAAVARRFAEEGARLAVAGLQAELLRDVARAAGAVPVPCDVTDDAEVKAAVAAAVAALGPVEILVNAAGIISLDDPATIEDAIWRKTLDVNLGGVMHICRAALPGMIARGGGAIVNVASVAAFNATPGAASYAASKAGVVAFTRAIANRYGEHGVRANCLCPGWVRTPMSEMEMAQAAAVQGISPEAAFRAMAERLALKRIADPIEMANCCLFLASDEASFVTGATLVADGGGRVPATARGV